MWKYILNNDIVILISVMVFMCLFVLCSSYILILSPFWLPGWICSVYIMWQLSLCMFSVMSSDYGVCQYVLSVCCWRMYGLGCVCVCVCVQCVVCHPRFFNERLGFCGGELFISIRFLFIYPISF